jgi:1-acyl-sn-glycerol-3-phosphate acyltransferase
MAVPLVRAYWAVVCRLLGFEVVTRGRMCVDQPVLYVCNHASYLDIFILGSVIPGFFVAKAEVSGWPVMGFLARIARTVFIERKTSRSAEQRDELSRRLDQGDSLILFPEGTSNDGNRVLPFKSSLFSIAERQGGRLIVQPVSIAYTRLDGMPMGRFLRPFFAWYGDMTLAPHIWEAIGLGVVRVEIDFHTPGTVAEAGTRKHLALQCHGVISRAVAQANAGRSGEPLPVLVPAPAAQQRVSAEIT